MNAVLLPVLIVIGVSCAAAAPIVKPRANGYRARSVVRLADGSPLHDGRENGLPQIDKVNASCAGKTRLAEPGKSLVTKDLRLAQLINEPKWLLRFLFLRRSLFLKSFCSFSRRAD
jgi:hypothetical protein